MSYSRRRINPEMTVGFYTNDSKGIDYKKNPGLYVVAVGLLVGIFVYGAYKKLKERNDKKPVEERDTENMLKLKAVGVGLLLLGAAVVVFQMKRTVLKSATETQSGRETAKQVGEVIKAGTVGYAKYQHYKAMVPVGILMLLAIFSLMAGSVPAFIGFTFFAFAIYKLTKMDVKTAESRSADQYALGTVLRVPNVKV